MRRIHTVLPFVLVFIILFAGSSPAATIYDNFNSGGGDAYNLFGGWFVSGPFSVGGTNYQYTSAMSFVPAGTFTFDSADLAVSLIQGSNELDVALAADNAGSPGGALESFHFSSEMGPFPSANPPLHADSLTHPLLDSGVPYWLVASAAGDTQAFWNYNTIGDVGGSQQETAGGPWSFSSLDDTGAFRITGTLIPEPATMTLFATGLVGVAVRLSRKRARTRA